MKLPKMKKISKKICSCFTLNAFKRLHVQHQWCNNNVMSSNPTQSPLLLESLTQIRPGISHLILELKKRYEWLLYPVRHCRFCPPGRASCMNSGSLLMIQLGAQSNQRGGRTRARQTHITEIWKTWGKHLQKQMTGVTPEEGVMVGGSE